MKRIFFVLFLIIPSLILFSQHNGKVLHYTQNNTGFPVSPKDFVIDPAGNFIIGHLFYYPEELGGVTIYDGKHWNLTAQGTDNFPFAEVGKVAYSAYDGSIYAFGGILHSDIAGQMMGIARFNPNSGTWQFIGDSTTLGSSCILCMYDMETDANGNLFIAHANGFMKVNENGFTKYYPPDQPGFYAKDIVPAPDGNFYLVEPHTDAWANPLVGLYYFDGTTVDTLKDPLDSLIYFNQAVADNNGNIWLISDNKLVRYSNGSETVFDVHVSGSSNKSITFDDGCIWIGTANGKLLRYNIAANNFQTYYLSGPYYPWGTWVRKIIPQGNYLYLYVDRGVIKFDKSAGKIAGYYNQLNSGLPGGDAALDGIKEIKIDKYGHYWINGLNKGISMFNGNYWKTFSAYDISNYSVVISNGFEITDDNYLISVSDSIRYWKEGQGWHSLRPPENISTGFYGYSVAAKTSDKIWIADMNGGLIKLNLSNQTYSLYEDDETGGRGPQKLFIDKDGNLWIGFAYSTPTMYDGSAFHHFGSSDGINWSNTFDITQAPNGAVWFAFYDNGIAKYENGTWTTFSDLPLSNVRTIAVDQSGKVWIGGDVSDTLGIFSSPDGVNWTKKIIDEKISSGTVMDITVDRNNNLFIATANNGLYVYNAQEIVLHTKNTATIAKSFRLMQNYPNPFNPTTTIEYSIPNVRSKNFSSQQNVQLKIYDVLGREIETLVNEKQSPGNYSVTFDASNLPSGIYFYRLQAGKYSEVKKMILMK